MIKAIFTNIKNEHRYLEEWLEYHIRLGFNKFILYEDEGSKSHEEIINKYNKVTNIDFYDYVLTNDNPEFKDITCFKHILENYNNIDWLIKLDPDEYIVLPGSMTIDDLLYNISDDFDQITLFWKLYNANGLIHAPSNKYSVVDTYIHNIEIEDLATYFSNNVSINGYDIGKSFIRYSKRFEYMNDTNSSMSISDAFPHWIYRLNEKTADGNALGIYINHYLTKSFEEFYDRLKNKGEYNKEYYRKLGDFFVLNPDLIDKIPEIEEEFNINIFTFKTKVN